MAAQQTMIDTQIMDFFSDVRSAMNISGEDIAAAMYDWELPELAPWEGLHLADRDGLDVTREMIDNIEYAFPEKTMTYKGRPIIVYQRDQFIPGVKYRNGRYGKYHVCFCNELRKKKDKHIFENRYVITYDTSGIFKVNISVRDKNAQGKVVTKVAESNVYKKLNVCEQCLYELNWRNFRDHAGTGEYWYKYGDDRARKKLVAEFVIKDFLYEARKKSFVLLRVDDTAELGTDAATDVKKYHNDPQYKSRIKSMRNYICDGCGKKFKENELEIHHRSHNEGENRLSNIMVICNSCHNIIHQEEGGLRNTYTEPTTITYADIQKNIGDMHRTGRGLKQDDKEANKHYALAAKGYEEAADEGEAEAEFKLAQMMSAGEGMPADKEAADKLFKKAAADYKKSADSGDPTACHVMYTMYSEGLGVKKDETAAEKMKVNAYKGYMKKPDKWGADDCIRISEVAPDENEAVRWKEKASFIYGVMADRGDAVAAYKHSELIENERDIEDEIELPPTEEDYKQSAEAFAKIVDNYEANQNVATVAKRALSGSNDAVKKLEKFYVDGDRDAFKALKELARNHNEEAERIIQEHGSVEDIMEMARLFM